MNCRLLIYRSLMIDFSPLFLSKLYLCDALELFDVVGHSQYFLKPYNTCLWNYLILHNSQCHVKWPLIHTHTHIYICTYLNSHRPVGISQLYSLLSLLHYSTSLSYPYCVVKSVFFEVLHFCIAIHPVDYIGCWEYIKIKHTDNPYMMPICSLFIY